MSGALPRLVGLVRRYGASREDSEEIAIDAILSTLARLDRVDFAVDGGKDPLFNYMAKTARHDVIQRNRRHLRETETVASVALLTSSRGSAADDPSEDDEPAAALESGRSTPTGGGASPASTYLLEFLDTLDEENKLLMRLYAEGVLTSEEIAEALGLQAAAVRKRWQRLSERAREFVERKTNNDVGA
jgi:RNA polymerase sigma factor (sigma-70 family)